MVTFFALPVPFFTSCGPYKKTYITKDLLGFLLTFQEVKKLETNPAEINKKGSTEKY